MRDAKLQSGSTTTPQVEAGPLTCAAMTWIVGILLGHWLGGVLSWIIAATSGGLIALLLLRRLRREPRIASFAVRSCGLVALACLAAAWANIDADRTTRLDIHQYLNEESQLARVVGVVDSQVNLVSPQRGAFAGFSYQSPVTMFALRVDRIVVDNEWRDTTGRLLVKIEQADHDLHRGMHIEATGWLSAIEAPYNPGERDYRAVMADRDIAGRLTLARRGNWRRIDAASTSIGSTLVDRFMTLRQSLNDLAADALHDGMAHDANRRAFLDALLLGRQEGGGFELYESFKRVGLAHILAISGAHLAILMGLVWIVARLIFHNPRRAATTALIVLVLYVLVVPTRVPILRAAIMAGVVLGAYRSGRRIAPLEMVGLATLIVLIWRPNDLFAAGFQLSFGVVAALLLLAKPVGQHIWPDPTVEVMGDRTRQNVARWVADYLAANLVAFLVAWPIVAYHFQLISPLSMLLSIMALPVIIAVLGLGYLKVLTGLLLPTVGQLLAGPLSWMADAMTGLVAHASTWPGAAIELQRPPSAAWAVATLGLMVAWLAGALRRRYVTTAVCLAACLTWAFVADRGVWVRGSTGASASSTTPALRLNMFAVGDGSCYLVRINDSQAGHVGIGSPMRTIMFDCGSQTYYDVGARSVVPALGRMGVDRIDALMLSHADMDHFVGVLDVVRHVRTRRVLAPPQMIAEARDEPKGTTAFLFDQLRELGHEVEPITQGWHEDLGDAQLEALWPPADFRATRANDTSLVLSVSAAGRRVVLNGDIQQDAITALLSGGGDLKADVCDLPHHGSFVAASPDWLQRVKPKLLLQSSGPSRLRTDAWEPLIEAAGATRLVTARDGMVEVTINGAGEMTWTTFRAAPPPSAATAERPAKAIGP